MNKFITFIILTFLLAAITCKERSNSFINHDVNYYFEKIKSDSVAKSDRIKFNDTLYNFLFHQKYDEINGDLLLKSAREYFKLGQNEQYFKAVNHIYHLAKNKKDTLCLAKSLCYLGDYYENDAQIDSAFKYYSKSQQLFEITHDSLNTARLIMYKAGVLYDAGIFTESEIETIAALKFLINSKNDRLIYESYNLMALNANELDNSESALNYFDLALARLKIMESNKYPLEKIKQSRNIIYNNIGRVYSKKKKYEQAIFFYNKALLNPDTEQTPFLYAMLLDNIACAKMKSGEKNGVENLFLEARKIRDSLQIKSGIVTGKIHQGEFYLSLKDTVKGLALLREGYQMAKEIESSYDIKNALQLLSLNDNYNRILYAKLFIKINDSIQNTERITRNKFARIAYETDQIKEKNEILSKKYSNLLILFGFSIFFIIVAAMIYRLKNKNKELLSIQEQQLSNEKIYQLFLQQQDLDQKVRNEERNRIGMELHDGIINRIFATRFNLALLQTNQPQRQELLVKELRAAEAEIRKVSHNLQQNLIFEEDRFHKALISLIEIQKNEYNTVFEYNIDKYIDWSTISSHNKIHLYRILQEALHNVNKYAKATRCYVFLLEKENQISMEITDNGIGFDATSTKRGIGLSNINQRTNALKGTLNINTSSSGTTIKVVFKYKLL